MKRMNTQEAMSSTDHILTDSGRPGSAVLTITAVSSATAAALMVEERKHITRNTHR